MMKLLTFFIFLVILDNVKYAINVQFVVKFSTETLFAPQTGTGCSFYVKQFMLNSAKSKSGCLVMFIMTIMKSRTLSGSTCEVETNYMH